MISLCNQSAFAADPVPVLVGTTIEAGSSSGVPAANRLPNIDVTVFQLEDGVPVDILGSGVTKLSAPTSSHDEFGLAEPGTQIVVCAGSLPGYTFSSVIINNGPVTVDPEGRDRHCISRTVPENPTFPVVFDYDADPLILVGAVIERDAAGGTQLADRLPGVEVEIFADSGASITSIGRGQTTLVAPTSFSEQFATAPVGTNLIVCAGNVVDYTFNAVVTNSGPTVPDPDGRNRNCISRTVPDNPTFPIVFDYDADPLILVGAVIERDAAGGNQIADRLPGVDVEIFADSGASITSIGSGQTTLDAPTSFSEQFATAPAGTNLIVCAGNVVDYTFNAVVTNSGPTVPDPDGQNRNCISRTVPDNPTFPIVFDYDADPLILVGAVVERDAAGGTQLADRLPGVEVEIFADSGASITSIGRGRTTLVAPTSFSEQFATAPVGTNLVVCAGNVPGFNFNAVVTNGGPTVTDPGGRSRNCISRTAPDNPTFPIVFDYLSIDPADICDPASTFRTISKTNTWFLLTVPCLAPPGTVFSDLFDGVQIANNQWGAFSYDALVPDYETITADTAVPPPGVGFWFITLKSLDLVMPAGSQKAARVDADECTAGPCYQQTIDESADWSLIGNPTNGNILYSEMLVSNESTLCTAPDTCTVASPVDPGIGSGYFAYDSLVGAYRRLGLGSNDQQVVKPWDGYWAKFLYNGVLAAEPWQLYSNEYPSKFIFVTDDRFTGDMGGVSGADAICQEVAEDAGLPGNYKAWLSDDGSSPNASFSKPNVPHLLVDGTLVAESYADLTNGDLLKNNIDTSATLQTDVDDAVWSNTRPDGTVFFLDKALSCQNWTSTAVNSNMGFTAPTENPELHWTVVPGKVNDCTTAGRLYCVGQ